MDGCNSFCYQKIQRKVVLCFFGSSWQVIIQIRVLLSLVSLNVLRSTIAKMSDDKAPDTVKLISAEGHEFIVDRRAAMVSGTIKSMLSGPGKVYRLRRST